VSRRKKETLWAGGRRKHGGQNKTRWSTVDSTTSSSFFSLNRCLRLRSRTPGRQGWVSVRGIHNRFRQQRRGGGLRSVYVVVAKEILLCRKNKKTPPIAPYIKLSEVGTSDRGFDTCYFDSNKLRKKYLTIGPIYISVRLFQLSDWQRVTSNFPIAFGLSKTCRAKNNLFLWIRVDLTSVTTTLCTLWRRSSKESLEQEGVVILRRCAPLNVDTTEPEATCRPYRNPAKCI
jgi:hypothetical protein